MARPTKPKTKKSTAVKKLAGKTVVFVGDTSTADYYYSEFVKVEPLVAMAGGKVAPASAASADFVVTTGELDAEQQKHLDKLRKRNPAAPVLDPLLFIHFLTQTPAELFRLLQTKPVARDPGYVLEHLVANALCPLDFRNADARGAFLGGAKLRGCPCDGADLRGANLQYAEFGNLKAVTFDNAKASNVYLADLDSCSFRDADLEKAWMFHGSASCVEGCNFTNAKMAKIRADTMKHEPPARFVDCAFTAADMSDAQVERTQFVRADFARTNLSRIHGYEAKFDQAKLPGACLYRADLRKASLAKADLRKADLREAVLCGADLRGARIDGADFAGASLSGAKIAGLDARRAKNFRPPEPRQTGPKLSELAKAAATSKDFVTTAEVELGKGEHAHLTVRSGAGSISARSVYKRDDNEAFDWIDAPSFEQGMINLAERWPRGALRLDTITARGCRSPRGKQLQELALAAWGEAFQLDAVAPEQLGAQMAKQQAGLHKLRETMLAEIRGGPAGVKKWNARSERERQQIGLLHGLDFKGANLAGIHLSWLDLQGSQFQGANLRKAELWSCKLEASNFTGADLTKARMAFIHCDASTSFENAKMAGCDMHISTLRNVNFRGADLSGADARRSWLEGADFTRAKVDGANLLHCEYDAQTRFPKGFVKPASMELQGPPPGTVVPTAPGSMDFTLFFQHLGYKIDGSRLSKALAMLKANRFQLFADVQDDLLVGVVKSQTDKDLVYSCRLAADGNFSCCTQNLKPCGGLSGSLCKHLVVLVVGLTKAGQLDAATVYQWVEASRKQKPALDKDAMSETFLRYKGAEAGEVDWRPTETIPEDYYAL